MVNEILYHEILGDGPVSQTPDYAGRVYISGPMRGIPHFNFPAFYRAEAHLRRLGWECFNPARADNEAEGYDVGAAAPNGREDETPVTPQEAMARDCKWICEHATAMYMLRGWENSTGAQAEWALARSIHLPIYYEVSL